VHKKNRKEQGNRPIPVYKAHVLSHATYQKSPILSLETYISLSKNNLFQEIAEKTGVSLQVGEFANQSTKAC
jgi:hypothetical protein